MEIDNSLLKMNVFNRNAVFGGFFRAESTEADNGRLVFVPVPPREGLYVASGLITLEHLGVGISAFVLKSPHVLPPLFFGALACFGGRLYEKKMQDITKARILIRCVEVFWLFCCLLQEKCLCMTEIPQLFSYVSTVQKQSGGFSGSPSP